MKPALFLIGALLMACGPSATPEPSPQPQPTVAASTPTPAPVDKPGVDKPGVDEAKRAELQKLLDELATLGTGAAVTVVLDGEPVSLVSGTVRADGEAVTPATLFSVQSVSKLFTAAMVHTMVHRGDLRRDDTVAKHLPGVKLEHEANIAGEVTLEQLLAHRGGLPHNLRDSDLQAMGLDFAKPTLWTAVTESITLSLRGAPGTYAYSNLGYGLLGAIIERTKQCAFATCMQTFLSSGLGLKTATFEPTTIEGSAAHGKLTDPKTGDAKFWPPAAYKSRYMLPYGGLWITMPELAQFGETLRHARDDDQAPLHAMVQADDERGHGLGPVFRQRFGTVGLEHDGGGPGFLAWLSTIPEKRMTLAVAVNGFDERNREQAKSFKASVDAMLDAAE